MRLFNSDSLFDCIGITRLLNEADFAFSLNR